MSTSDLARPQFRAISGVQHRIVLALALVTLPAQAAAPAEAPGLSLGASSAAGPLRIAEAVRLAMSSNPQLAAARSSALAAERRIRPAGALADPQVELSVSDLGVDGGGRKAELMVRQMIDWPGKRPLMREEMRAMASMSAQETAELELELEARVREAFWNLHLVRENLALARQTLGILADFVQIAETRYALGAGIQQDVLRAQAETFKLESRIAGFRQEERARLATLNVLLGRSASEPIEILLDSAMVPALPADAGALAEEALLRRPMLRAMQLEVHRHEVRTALARKDTWPNLELQAGVMRMGPAEVPAIAAMAALDAPAVTTMPSDTAFSLGVMASIPLWKSSKQEERVAESRQEREAAAARLEAARLEIGYEVQTLLDQSRRLREQIRLYDDEVLPRDRQAVDSALESYQVGQADFLTLLSSQISALEDQIELHRLHAEYNKSLARLERAAGRGAEPPAAVPALGAAVSVLPSPTSIAKTLNREDDHVQ
jgi:outer membrane protein, heavy metal efflux system